MDESRKQFEEWYVSYFGEIPAWHIFGFEIMETGDYESNRINNLWQAWQASRQALQDNQKGE
ncbi:hypothetical protein [Rosenbergiella epipactidis]|uniref:hypothetical protein n=1 Tax=Rosenbergiella epipactidis TaxID=1544694 RepID=UPI001F4D404D|nr:hypothetical protein [Rosenbergiella epipactidis]